MRATRTMIHRRLVRVFIDDVTSKFCGGRIFEQRGERGREGGREGEKEGGLDVSWFLGVD